MIFISLNDSNKEFYRKHFFKDSISFAKINDWYQKNFGSVVPIVDITEDNTTKVFSETINYESMDNYLDGKILRVKDNYMVPTFESGVVVFIGEKEHYGNTLIIQGVDGVDIWYCNINSDDINLYDYLKKGSLLGPVYNNNLYLLFMKDNEFISYEEYNKI